MILSVVLVLAGFASLIFGANWLVDGASSLAKKFRVSDLVIGLTIVAFGTSAPELVVNIIASLKGFSDIVLGNVLGSNNFNLFIILGLSGIILPILVQSSTAWKEIPISLAIFGILFVFLNFSSIGGEALLSRMEGIILFILFLTFLYYVFNQMKKDKTPESEPSEKPGIKIAGLIIIGLAGLIIGGQLVVVNSVEIATQMKISEKIIGLTIVAAGTSLPELVTSIMAAVKKNSDIAIGNVIGSNIFNVLLILSISSIITPIEYSPKFNTDIYILMGGTIFLLIAMLSGIRKKLDRWEAAILFLFYLSYIIYAVLSA